MKLRIAKKIRRVWYQFHEIGRDIRCPWRLSTARRAEVREYKSQLRFSRKAKQRMKRFELPCTACGAMMVSRQEDFSHPVLGVAGLILVSIEVWRCACGEFEPVIPCLDQLYKALEGLKRPAKARFINHRWSIEDA